MLMVVESPREIEASQLVAAALRPASILRSYATALWSEPREGDVFSFGPERAPVEVVIGFRPGIDRLLIQTSRATGGDRLLTTEEAGSVVIVDAAKRRIVLEGIGLDDMQQGDVEVLATA